MGAAEVIFFGLMISVRLEQGRLDEMRPALERAVRTSSRDALAFVLAHTGEFDAAEAELRAVEPASGLPDDGLLVGTLALRMFAIHDLAGAGCVRPATEARTICDRLRPATGQLVMYAGGIGVWARSTSSLRWRCWRAATTSRRSARCGRR